MPKFKAGGANLLTQWALGDVAVLDLVIFKLISRMDVMNISCETALGLRPQDPPDD